MRLERQNAYPSARLVSAHRPRVPVLAVSPRPETIRRLNLLFGVQCVIAKDWDSLTAHALELQRCDGGGQVIFYPRPMCPSCMSDDLTWTKVSGRGVVHAFTIPHRHPNKAFAAEVPYVVALIELEEGVRLLSTLVDVAPTPDAAGLTARP